MNSKSFIDPKLEKFLKESGKKRKNLQIWAQVLQVDAENDESFGDTQLQIFS